MAGVTKPVGTEGLCNTTLSTYSNAPLIRLWNSNTTTAFLVTRAVNSSVTIGTVTIGPNMEMVIKKEPADVLSSNVATAQIFAAPIAFASA